MPFVIFGAVDFFLALVGAVSHPIRSKYPASSLGRTAETAYTFVRENLPSFAIGCQRNTHGRSVVCGVAKSVVFSVVPIDSFSVVDGVVEESSCGGIIDGLSEESLDETDLITIVENRRVLPIAQNDARQYG